MRRPESLLPTDYKKKVIRNEQSCSLLNTFTTEQVTKRIAFYKELNARREVLKEQISKHHHQVFKKFVLYGYEDTTTVRVYMRETISKIAAELFVSDYSLAVQNVNSRAADGYDKDHGYVVVSIEATLPEIDALLGYIRAGVSYYVYDGEKDKYVVGDTEGSEFIIVQKDSAEQPEKYWRRSQSFVAAVREI